MDYKCFLCKKEFIDQNKTAQHLKKDHFVKERKDPIYCIKNNSCNRYFHTFRALNDHSKNCPVDIQPQV